MRIRRRAFLALFAASLAGAQPATRAARVMILGNPSPKSREGWQRLFASEGFIEGRNFELEFFALDGEPVGRSERQAHAVVAARPDVILLPGGSAIALFKQLTRDIPIVFFSLGGDPVRMGLVESYRRPGGNVTGSTNLGIEATGKGWEVLKELRPSARRAGALFDEQYLSNEWVPMVRAAQSAAAQRLGMELREIVVPSNAGFAPVERALRQAAVDVLDVSDGGWAWTAELRAFLERASIPALWEMEAHVRNGGLLCVTGSFNEALERAVAITGSILRGANPAATPVQEARRIEITLNLRTARAMKLAIPQAVLLRAVTVIQ